MLLALDVVAASGQEESSTHMDGSWSMIRVTANWQGIGLPGTITGRSGSIEKASESSEAFRGVMKSFPTGMLPLLGSTLTDAPISS